MVALIVKRRHCLAESRRDFVVEGNAGGRVGGPGETDGGGGGVRGTGGGFKILNPEPRVAIEGAGGKILEGVESTAAHEVYFAGEIRVIAGLASNAELEDVVAAAEGNEDGAIK